MAVALVRYGSIPEVARFEVGAAGDLRRGAAVVVETHRGLQLGTFLGSASVGAAGLSEDHSAADQVPRPLLRTATDDDLQAAAALKHEADALFDVWAGRIAEWQLGLELIDLEWTLDRMKLVLYVLNERGPDCTRLALQAAAGGYGLIEVQPVAAEGLVMQPSGGGGGGGCGSCGCS